MRKCRLCLLHCWMIHFKLCVLSFSHGYFKMEILSRPCGQCFYSNLPLEYVKIVDIQFFLPKNNNGESHCYIRIESAKEVCFNFCHSHKWRHCFKYEGRCFESVWWRTHWRLEDTDNASSTSQRGRHTVAKLLHAGVDPRIVASWALSQRGKAVSETAGTLQHWHMAPSEQGSPQPW